MKDVAIIGAGQWGRNHVRAWSELRDDNTVYLAEKDETRLSDLSKRYGIKALSNHEEILDKDVELVNIRVIGVGKGRGMAMFVVLAGLMTLIATTVAFFSPRVRQVERELPDAFSVSATNSGRV